MIPKKIHYCWFGGNEYPKLVKNCISSWKENLVGYEFVEWNENNFDIESNQFVKEAFYEKKYAFVSDYVRLFALYNHGGIYLDTDVQVIKPLDDLLYLCAFTGRESDDTYVTGTMGAEEKHPWIKELLEYYSNKSFYDNDGSKTNTTIISEIVKKRYREIENFDSSDIFSTSEVTIFPFEYFCAKDYKTGEIKVTKNTYTIHHFNGSWLSKKKKVKKILGKIYRRYIKSL